MHKLRAFLIEDNPIIRDSLTEALEEQAGIEVVATAVDQEQALAWMNSRTDGCDVVIVDIFLRAGSGLGVLKGMTDYKAPPARVVLTNYATPDMRERCRELGAEAVFDKSQEIEELMAWLRSRRAVH